MSPELARQLVVYHRRAGGQSQFSALLELEPKSDRIQSALAYAKRNLTSKLTVNRRSLMQNHWDPPAATHPNLMPASTDH